MSSFLSWWKEQDWGINLAKKINLKRKIILLGLVWGCLGCSSPEPAVSLSIRRDTGMVCGRKKAIRLEASLKPQPEAPPTSDSMFPVFFLLLRTFVM